jgi:hypothetical protein
MNSTLKEIEEKQKKEKNQRKDRKCLKCDRKFTSTHSHNRICYRCKLKNEMMDIINDTYY